MITLLIVSIALAMTAPIVTKKMMYSSTNVNIEQIKNELRKELVPKGAVVFFNTNCPTEGWKNVNSSWNGRYPKMVSSADEIGVQAQSVLRHKHISPYINVKYTDKTTTSGTDMNAKYRRFGYFDHSYTWHGGRWHSSDDTMKTQVFTNDGAPDNSPNRIAADGGLLVDPNINVKVLDTGISTEPQQIIVGDENRPKTVKLVACEKI